jgi:hypothetical protein
LPTKSSSFCVVFQTDDESLWKATEMSSFAASTEAGSSGASPPAGDATVISVLEERT